MKDWKYKLAIVVLKILNKFLFKFACKTENEIDDILTFELARLIIDFEYRVYGDPKDVKTK